MKETLVLLGIGSLTVAVCSGIVIYIKQIKKKMKGFVLERKKIEKYFQEN